MEAIGRLAGGIAHDFNNLLTAILGYTQLLRRRIADDNPMQQELGEVENAGRRAANLVAQLLAFSRKQTLQPTVLDLNLLLTDAEPMLRTMIGEDVEISLDLEPGLWRTEADAGQLEQVIMNLAVNARDAMPKGGTLTLRTRNLELERNVRGSELDSSPGDYVLLTIDDTGFGMDSETASHAFEPFFTTKEQGKGTGLGLSTVHGIINQSGGHIDLRSEPGEGTTLRILLPRVDAVADLIPVHPLSSHMPGGVETVLLVEDEPEVRGLVKSVLSRLGYAVIEASDGQEALSVLLAHASEEIHLLLTDVVMPKMGGIEAAKRILEMRPGIKVLFVSGYATDGLGYDIEPISPNWFLAKPFTPVGLAQKVRNVLDAPLAFK